MDKQQKNLIRIITQHSLNEFIDNFEIKLQYKKSKCLDDLNIPYDCPFTNVFINNIFIYQYNGNKLPLNLKDFKRLQNISTSSIFKKYKKKNYEDYVKDHYTNVKREIHKHFVEQCVIRNILVPEKVYENYFYINNYKKYYIKCLIFELYSLKIAFKSWKNKQK